MFKRIILALSLFFVAHSAYAQQNPRPSDIIGMRVLGQPVASEYGKWEMRASSQITTAGTSTTVSIDAATAVVPEGMGIMPITTRIPLRIVDGANSETVTPTAVSCAQNSGVCTFTAVFANTHRNQFRIRSGSSGLQEAIDDTLNGGVVLVTQGWAGTTSMITGATGATTVSIIDMRNGNEIFYAWDGADYVVTFNPVTSTFTDLTVTDALTIGGATTLNGSLGVTGAATFASTLTISSLTANRLVSTGTGGLLQTTIASANAAASISDETGSGLMVFATSPTLTTPVLGVATATSINKVAITAPATSATLTVADGKTLTASNTLTFTGTDTSSVAFGAGGTVAYTANKLSVFAATTSAEFAGVISDETGTGLVVLATAPVFPTSITMGAVGGTTGSALFKGTTSGTVTIQSAAAAGTWSLTLPTNDGDASQYLQTNGSGVTSWATIAAAADDNTVQIPVWRYLDSNPPTEVLVGTYGYVTSFAASGTDYAIHRFTVPQDWDGTSDLVFSFLASTSTASAANVKIDMACDIIVDNGAVTFAGAIAVTDTFVWENSTNAQTKTGTNLKLTAAQMIAAGNGVNCAVSRDNAVGSNHAGALYLMALEGRYNQ